MNRYLERAIADARIVEVRHFSDGRIASGLFDNIRHLRAALTELSATGNTYTSLNAPRDVQATNAMTSAALRDEDIATIVRLPFDFDPERPKDSPSTEAELQAARRARDRLVRSLSALGWPVPAIATSGNGSHALYRCRIAASTELREMLAVLYRGMQAEFSTPEAAFDSTVRNPSRIWRAYGTINRKGEPSSERPHRLSVVIMPSRWEGVSPRQIEGLANRYAKQKPERRESVNIGRDIAGRWGDYRSLDVVSWFQAHGGYKRHLMSGKHAVTCPWLDEHTSADGHHKTDTVIWEAEGDCWPSFHCSHAHCDGRSILDVMRLWGDADRFCARAYERAAA